MNTVAAQSLRLAEDGLVLLPEFAARGTVEKLEAGLTETFSNQSRAGVRSLLRVCPPIAEFAASPELIQRLTPFTTRPSFAVRGILFDKTPDANWLVAWHQDLTIAVRERRDVPGFGPWSMKDGTPHVQPPAELLARMLTVRLHLDDCDISNGALRVLPGSHRHGKLSAAQIKECRERTPEHVCEARAGDALVMRPLLLHASSPASVPKHRRVIHLEFAVDELPDGLVWAERISR
jgi:ectoine hydroxylase-related dioxygenase (phytanoyl-CoA dioxygenase family)